MCKLVDFSCIQKMLSSAVLFVALLICSWADGSPTGAPTEACSSLTPGHGFAPQGSYSPYITIPSKVFHFLY